MRMRRIRVGMREIAVGIIFQNSLLKNEIVKVKHVKPIQENSKNSIYK